tara:strand:+ start:1735 stop:2532 length:798 start_codon:yes stop_codon:yes gene_type:complete
MTNEYCPITGNVMTHAFSETLLNKYKVNYFYCEESGFLKAEKPYWLEEAYQDAIANTDTGLVARNLKNSEWLEPILHNLFDANSKFVDVSGGYGLLTRCLRDRGFDCFSIDVYCQNLFASAFEPPEGISANCLFAFEVLEHIENPYDFLVENFSKYSCNSILFSTLTFDGELPNKDWWYYSFETGQHISFFQPKTLKLMGEKLGVYYYNLSPELHFYSKDKLTPLSLALIKNKRLRKFYAAHVRKKRKKLGKTWDDHLLMKQKLK